MRHHEHSIKTLEQITDKTGSRLAFRSAYGGNMIKAWVTTVLLVLFAVPAGQAADNMKAFPPAEEGMVRYVLQLPKQDDESAFKVELIVGKTVQVDERKQILLRRQDRGGNNQGLGIHTLQGQQAWADGGHADGGRSKRAEGGPVHHAWRRTLSHPLQQPFAHRGLCARRR